MTFSDKGIEIQEKNLDMGCFCPSKRELENIICLRLPAIILSEKDTPVHKTVKILTFPACYPAVMMR